MNNVEAEMVAEFFTPEGWMSDDAPCRDWHTMLQELDEEFQESEFKIIERFGGWVIVEWEFGKYQIRKVDLNELTCEAYSSSRKLEEAYNLFIEAIKPLQMKVIERILKEQGRAAASAQCRIYGFH